jgi:photosystem II stability/assembly factor-like uncharacterized protein
MIAAPSATQLVVANGGASGNGQVTFSLAISTDGGLTWRRVVTDHELIDPAAPGSAFLGFEDAAVGRWVGDGRAIWTTQDGGLHWQRRPFP